MDIYIYCTTLHLPYFYILSPFILTTLYIVCIISILDHNSHFEEIKCLIHFLTVPLPARGAAMTLLHICWTPGYLSFKTIWVNGIMLCKRLDQEVKTCAQAPAQSPIAVWPQASQYCPWAFIFISKKLDHREWLPLETMSIFRWKRNRKHPEEE